MFVVTVFHRFFRLLPLALVVLFLLLNPVQLNPGLYGLLAACLGLTGLILYLLNYPINRASLFFGALTGLVSLVAALTSGYPWNGFEYTVVVGSAVVLTTSLAVARDDLRRQWLFLGLGLLGFGCLVDLGLEYYQQVSLFGWYGLARLPVVEFRNPNVMARVMGLIGIGLFVLPERKLLKTTSIPFLFLLLLTGSRGAILALVLAGLVYVWIKSNTSIRNVGGPVLWIAIAVLIVVTVVILSPSAVADVTNMQRVQLLQESVDLLTEYPLTGVGPWNFGLVYPQFSLDGQWQRHPHSLPLWLLTAFGFGGAVVLLSVAPFVLVGGFRAEYLPVVVFLGTHELVDTMVWIPGVLFLSLVLLVAGWRSDTSSARSSPLLPVVCLLLVASGFIVWKTDTDFKRGLEHYRAQDYEAAKEYWWNDWAGVTNAHRSVVLAKQGNTSAALQALQDARRVNSFDPHYLRIGARLHERLGNKSRAREYRSRYREMDPHQMLTLGKQERTNGEGESIDSRGTTSFIQLWRNQRKPRYYLFLVEEARERGDPQLAGRRIDFLLNMPKLTRQARTSLLRYREELAGSTESEASPSVSEGSRVPEKTMFRNQFHYFFYRRPGFDYVTNRSHD